MDMDIPAVTHEEVLVRLREDFYQVVPAAFQTCCIFAASICCKVLRHFGFDARVVPCQLWWAGPDKNFVVGFYKTASDKQWNGHAVCVANGWLIDAAPRQFQKQFGLDVPGILVTRTFGITSNVIGRYTLSDDTHLWWHEPPGDDEVAIPSEPEELIDRYAQALVQRVQTQLQGKQRPRPDFPLTCWQSV
jgi:hypothetical protein